VEGLSAARGLIEGFAPRHAGIGQDACLCELTSTDLLQCADSAHWMVTGAAVVALRIQPQHQRGAGLTDYLYQLGGGEGGSGQAGNR